VLRRSWTHCGRNSRRPSTAASLYKPALNAKNGSRLRRARVDQTKSIARMPAACGSLAKAKDIASARESGKSLFVAELRPYYSSYMAERGLKWQQPVVYESSGS